MQFVWKIENFSCIRDDFLQSPSFSAYSNTWEVVIYPKRISGNNDYFSIKLLQLTRQCTYELRSSFAFLDSGGAPLIWREQPLNRSHYLPASESFIHSDIFGSRKYDFLPNDILTVQCCLWKTNDVFICDTKRFARTRIEPQKWLIAKTFTCDAKLKNFSMEKFEREELIKRDIDTLKIDLSFKEEVNITLTPPLRRMSANIKIWLLDATGKKIQFGMDEYIFNRDNRQLKIETRITRSFLQLYRNLFLPNDTLSLQLTCTLSSDVTFSRLVEENETFEDNPVPFVEVPVSEQITSNETMNVQSQESDLSNTISHALWDMYEEGFLSDFNLRVGDKVFPIHRALLGIRSPLFRTMFTADLKDVEVANGCFDIPDMDADTLQKMLQFIYTDKVDSDMPWKTAANLYAAATKYGLEPLKQGCSSWFKSRLCVASVLDVLLLAESHQDQDLKDAALDFITLNDREIVGTDSWKRFEEENTRLALETCRELYLKKMKVALQKSDDIESDDTESDE